jgi:hypothetical protein
LDNLKEQQKTKNEHYVPQMYIERFGYGSDDKIRISVLFKDNGKIIDNQNPKNYASKRYFYDTTEDVLSEILKHDFKMFPILKDNKNIKDEQFLFRLFILWHIVLKVLEI